MREKACSSQSSVTIDQTFKLQIYKSRPRCLTGEEAEKINPPKLPVVMVVVIVMVVMVMVMVMVVMMVVMVSIVGPKFANPPNSKPNPTARLTQ